MREIKFRAWHKAERRIYPVSCLYFEGIMTVRLVGHLYNWKEYSIGEEVELMQYTGLKDKNGKEVYEGDICTMKDGMVYSSTAHRMVEGRYQVHWNDDRWGLRHGELEDYDNGDYYHGDEIEWNECEVIGNIYEHPELR